MTALGLNVRAAQPGDYEQCLRAMAELGVDDPLPDREGWQSRMCTPFVAVSARAAFSLLATLPPPAAEARELTLVIHDDAALAKALVEAGAREILETVHYRGPLNSAGT